MKRKSNPAVLGAFVVGALALAVAGLVVFGGGKFFRTTQKWVAYFDESIKGLAVGAPVTFRGVKLGQVTEIQVVLDRGSMQVTTPVVFELEADRLTTADGTKLEFSPGKEGAKVLFGRGLRAQLETQSFVTGQLAINLEFHPNTPAQFRGGERAKYSEVPTIPSTVAALGKSLDQLNFSEISEDIRSTLKGIERMVNSPEIGKVLVSAASAVERMDKLAANADAKLNALGPAIERTSAEANETLATIRSLAASVQRDTVPAATEALQSVRQLASRVDAETVPATNQLIAQVQQLAANLEKTSDAARTTLGQVQSFAATAEATIEHGSPLHYQLDITLRELSGAARSFRGLAAYLERYPESVIHGKNNRK